MIKVIAAEHEAAASKLDQVPAPRAPEIAFAGRSNVGKSSLLNMVLSRKGRARTSNTPGRTRQIHLFGATVEREKKGADGEPAKERLDLVLVDLPGYGYAKVSKSESASWRPLIEGFLRARPVLRALVVLVDIRRGVEEEERDLLEFMAKVRPDVRVLIVATKVDKLSLSARKPAIRKLGEAAGLRVLGVSAETGLGREEVWGAVLGAVALDGPIV